MREIHSYRVELKFDCECGSENLQAFSLTTPELTTEDEVGFMVAVQPAPQCQKCGRTHTEKLGIGVKRMGAEMATIRG
jgi:hypothetical protein